MAATIILAPNETWTSGSLAFRAIAVTPRLRLKEIAPDIEERVYESVDNGLDFMDFSNLTSADYSKVFMWLKGHYQACEREGKMGYLEPQYFEGAMKLFGQLLSAMGKAREF